MPGSASAGGFADGVGDVVGDLESLDADGLAIRSADGSLVVIAAAAVVAARVVGPSMRSALELEAVSGRSWPALEEGMARAMVAAGGRRLHGSGELGTGAG